jgi:hypothetical protein
MNTNLRTWRSKYSHMLVSARRDRSPVIAFGYGTSEFYAIAARAQELAQSALGATATLSRIYFVFPSTYLEFADGQGGHYVVSQHFERTWSSRQAFTSYVTDTKAELAKQFPVDEAAVAAYHNREWDKAMTHAAGSFSEVFIPNVELVPFYDWSYGCTPTAGAMVCGYVDRVQNSGRMVDWFYQRQDGVEGENDWQIPNIQRECAIEMSTDTTTGGTSIYSISNGLAQVSTEAGYYWSVTNEQGASWNDWSWATITAEIDAGHVMIWSALWETHSLTGCGYRTDDKFVYVHNTWWTPAEWWTHSGDNYCHVAAVTPDAGDERNIHIIYPIGDTFYNSNGRGEVLYVGDTVRVTWDNNGHPGTGVDIDLSVNGGRSWSPLVAGVADSGAWHWAISEALSAGDSLRLRLSQYDGSTLVSGDGSFGNFRMLKEPLPPVQLAPPNGLPVMNPPIVLVVDSLTKCDSIDFRVAYGTDTIWRQHGCATTCPLPDSLFEKNKTYKWQVRGHNRYGWGAWSTVWSFRILFENAVEEGRVVELPAFAAPAVSRLDAAELSFDVRGFGPGTKLVLFDALGNVVRDLEVSRPGRIGWDLRDNSGAKVAAGFYFVQLGAGKDRMTRKLVLLD